MDRISVFQKGVELFEQIPGKIRCNPVTLDQNGVASGIDIQLKRISHFLQMAIALAKQLAGQFIVGKFES
jgi:hypothetical protein